MPTPFTLALPIKYWAFNFAGGWFVSTDLEPDHRAIHLAMVSDALILSITILAMFSACLLLWIDRCHPILSGIGTVILGLLSIPAMAFIAIGIHCHFTAPN